MKDKEEPKEEGEEYITPDKWPKYYQEKYAEISGLEDTRDEVKKPKKELKILNIADLVNIHDPTLYKSQFNLEEEAICIKGVLLSRSSPIAQPRTIVLKDGRMIELLGPYDFFKYEKFNVKELKNYYILRLCDTRYYDQIISIYVPEDLKDKVLDLRFGEEIIAKGIVREIFKRSKVIRYFQAKDVERIEKRVEVSEEEIEKLREQIIKVKDNDPDEIADFFFENIRGLFDLKLSALAVAISGGAKVFKNGTEKNGAIHALILSKTGGAKSLMADILKNLMKGVAPCVYADASKATAVGLVGGVDQLETGERVIRVGLLPMANGGLAMIDELDKIKDPNDLANMNTAMTDGYIMISKAGKYIRSEAFSGILAFANPFDLDKLQKRLSTIGLTESLKGHESFYDRFAIIQYYKPIVDKAVFMDMLKQRTIEEDKKLPLKRKLLVAMRNTYRKLLLNPNYEPEIEEYLINKASELAEELRLLGEKTISLSPRIFEHLERLAIFFASLRLKEKVEKEDIDLASEFLRNTARFKPELIVRLGGSESAFGEAKTKIMNLCRELGRPVSSTELWEALEEDYANDREVFEFLFGKEPVVRSNWKWRRVLERLRKDPDIIYDRGAHGEYQFWYKGISQRQSEESEQSEASPIVVSDSPLYKSKEEKQKPIEKTPHSTHPTHSNSNLKIEPTLKLVIDHLSKIKVDTLDNIHLVLEKKGINIPKEDLLKIIKKYAEQGLFMVTEKELNGEKITLVRLLRDIIIHGEKDLKARILELCKEWINEKELFKKLRGEGYTHEEIMKAIEELIEKGKLLFLRGKYRVR